MKFTSYLSYIVIYLSPVYYLAYYFPSIDFGMMAGLVISIGMCGTLLKEEEGGRLAKELYILLGLGVVYFIVRLSMGIFNVLEVLNPSYLHWKLGSYLFFSVVYLFITLLQFWQLLKISGIKRRPSLPRK